MIALLNPHFIKQEASLTELLSNEQDIPHIHCYAPLKIIIVLPIAGHRLIIQITFIKYTMTKLIFNLVIAGKRIAGFS